MFSLKTRFDTQSLFFGFVIGFCLYLFISHVILDKVIFASAPSHDIDANYNFVKMNANKNTMRHWTPRSIVPWVYFNNMEGLVNSERFAGEINKPPQKVSSGAAATVKESRNRGQFYGGGDVDEKHLGGWKFNDSDTYERELWDWIIDTFNITSVMDIGCGIGCSTLYFKQHANIADVLCVEGSIDAINHSLVPQESVHHDYTRGAYWPSKVYDMVWSAEFLEHVEFEALHNVMATFKAAKILFVTHSAWGGWHHVNVHDSEWWIYQFESFGFSYQDKITEKARQMCPLLGTDFKYGPNSWHDLHTDGNRKNSHFHFRGLVFFNKLFMNRMTEFDQRIFNLLHT